MRGSRWLVIGLGCVVLMVLRPAFSSASSPARSLAAIALQTQDLPRGFFASSGEWQTNLRIAELDAVSVASLEKEGRLLGYFTLNLRDSGRGLVQIDDDIVEFRTARDAQAEYRRVVARDFRSIRGYSDRRLSHPTRQTGLISHLCLCTFYRETVDSLYGAKGPYFYWIELHDVAGTVSPERMVHALLRYSALVTHRMPRRPLPLPTSLPLPPGPATAPTPSPAPASGPLIPIACSYVSELYTMGVGVYDKVNGGRVCVETRTDEGSRNFSGYLTAGGGSPPRGDMFLYPWVSERKFGGTRPFVSSFRNIRVRGRDGRIFAVRAGTPYQLGASALRTVQLTPGPQINSGSVLAVVPEHDGPYTILWNEGDAIPFTPVATLAVFPSH